MRSLNSEAHYYQLTGACVVEKSAAGTSSSESDSGKFLQSISVPKQTNYNRWSPMEQGVTLAWKDVNVYVAGSRNGVKGYKAIVNNSTGAVKAGSLVALMGASGSGKTTLMTALSFRSPGNTTVKGDIMVNGYPIGDYMRHLSGFMHQEDLFVGALTVWEHMNIMGHLKFDRRISNSERKHKIRELLRQLGLTKCMNTAIGLAGDRKVLSGGEIKRLAFATELLTDPQLLFCDEPTTGLDSYSAQKIVKMMNEMSSRGRTIVCTIHQPSSEIFAMFSQLILLADGRIAYIGSTANAMSFFHNLGYRCPNNYNPADFFIKTLAVPPRTEKIGKQTIKDICDNFASSTYFKEIYVVVQYEFHMGRSSQAKSFTKRSNFKEIFWWKRLYWLIYRCLLSICRDTSLQIARIIQKIIIALIIGFCYIGTINTTQNGIQSVQGALFLFVTENTFNPMYATLAAFPLDRPLFLREYKSGLYSVGSYYLSKVIALFPGLLLEAVTFTIAAYWLAGLKSSVDAFLLTTLIVILTINVSISCGILFSNAFDSIPNAMTCLVPFDFLLMLTSGLFIKLSSLPYYLNWTKYLSWIMYSTESLTIIQWNGVHNITCDSSKPELPCLRDGSEVLQKYSFSSENLNRDLWNMFFLSAAFHVLGFLCLFRKIKNK